MESIQKKVRDLEKENSEMKAAKLMSMFNGGSSTTPGGSNPYGHGISRDSQNTVRMIESLKV